jgi:DNA-binding transcriptional regulator PaaX
MHAFRDFSLHDPELPDSIVPLQELRLRAVAVFDAVYEGLSAAAARYFDAVAAPGRLEPAR